MIVELRSLCGTTPWSLLALETEIGFTDDHKCTRRGWGRDLPLLENFLFFFVVVGFLFFYPGKC